MSKYFGVPFANTGDKTSIPDASQPSGDVSFEDGWTPDYAKDQATDPNAKDLPRQSENYFKFTVTEALKELQEYGVKIYDPLVNYPINGESLGSDGIKYDCKIPNGPGTSIVDPVGDTTSTWVATPQNAALNNNLLINPEMLVNQRAFAGGALAAGDYGFDRWKASTGGGNLSAASGIVTMNSGGIEQIIEAPGIAGKTVVLSADLTSGDLDYDIEGETGTLTGVGLQFAVVEIPGGSTGNITVKLSVSGATVFGELKLEIGSLTRFLRRPIEQEWSLCLRYYFEITGPVLTLTYNNDLTIRGATIWHPSVMRVQPSVTHASSTGNTTFFTGSKEFTAIKVDTVLITSSVTITTLTADAEL